jgi:crossover junction endodeoxyribonuclease RuvC
MVVAGFDPGSICFGIGILTRDAGKIRYVHSTEINLKDKSFNDRMVHLWQELEHIFSRYPIMDAAIEEGFLGKNIRSMNILAMVRGVVLGFLIKQKMNLTSYSPRQIKLAVTGNGNAMKSQVNKSMKILLNLKNNELGSDESDALAVAYCHLMLVK